MTIIEGYYAGDDLQLERDVAGVETTDPVVKAWLTIKTALSVLDADATIQKVVTTNAVQGVGQITEDGSELQGNGTATVIAQLTAADTALLGAAMTYVYDFQCKSASGKIYTVDQGRIRFTKGVTDATS